MNPKTLEEAKKIKYGFAWDMKRRYYIDGQCAFEVWNYSKKIHLFCVINANAKTDTESMDFTASNMLKRLNRNGE